MYKHYLSVITTQLIEASRLGNEDLDIIGTMLRRNYIQCKDKGTEKTYQLDLSIDRFVQNIYQDCWPRSYLFLQY